MNNNYTIDFPYLNYKFNRGDFVKNIIFTHLVPYVLASKFEDEEERKKWQRLATVKTQKMILDLQDKVKKKNTYKIDAISDVNIKDQSSDYFAYKLEYDFYQKLGGDDAFYNTCIWNDVTNFIKIKAGYLLSIYTVMKLYMDKWDEYNKYKEEGIKQENKDKEPSLEKCYIECGDEDYDGINFPLQSFKTKTIKEDIWKEFKNSAHLIYGYIAALIEKNLIPIPEENVNKPSFIDKYIVPILADLDNNSKYLREILGYALKAQNYRLNCIHSKGSKKIDIWLLPEDKLKENYGIRPK